MDGRSLPDSWEEFVFQQFVNGQSGGESPQALGIQPMEIARALSTVLGKGSGRQYPPPASQPIDNRGGLPIMGDPGFAHVQPKPTPRPFPPSVGQPSQPGNGIPGYVPPVAPRPMPVAGGPAPVGPISGAPRPGAPAPPSIPGGPENGPMTPEVKGSPTWATPINPYSMVHKSLRAKQVLGIRPGEAPAGATGRR